MGPIFYKKILKHGPIFWLSPNFWVENPQNCKICENGPIFQEKSLMGTLFCQNDS